MGLGQAFGHLGWDLVSQGLGAPGEESDRRHHLISSALSNLPLSAVPTCIRTQKLALFMQL